MKRALVNMVSALLIIVCMAGLFTVSASADALCVLYYGSDYPDSTVSLTLGENVGGEMQWSYPFSYEKGYAEFRPRVRDNGNLLILELIDLLTEYKGTRDLFAVIKYQSNIKLSETKTSYIHYRVDGSDNNVVNVPIEQDIYTGEGWGYLMLSFKKIPKENILDKILFTLHPTTLQEGSSEGGYLRIACIEFYTSETEAKNRTEGLIAGSESKEAALPANVQFLTLDSSMPTSDKGNIVSDVPAMQNGKSDICAPIAIALGGVALIGLGITSVVLIKRKVKA